MDELLDELDILSEYELGSEWMRAYNQVNLDRMIWGDLSSEERDFTTQRISYLIEEGNRLYREEL